MSVTDTKIKLAEYFFKNRRIDVDQKFNFTVWQRIDEVYKRTKKILWHSLSAT